MRRELPAPWPQPAPPELLPRPAPPEAPWVRLLLRESLPRESLPLEPPAPVLRRLTPERLPLPERHSPAEPDGWPRDKSS
jgi:hypothetical protein